MVHEIKNNHNIVFTIQLQILDPPLYMYSGEIRDFARLWDTGFKIPDSKMKNHPKIGLRSKHFQDFETRPKFSETQIFQGTILYQ